MSIRDAIQVHGAAVDRLEDAYQAAQGEITEDVAQAEGLAREAVESLLDAHARYQMWLDDQSDAVDREQTRLYAEAERIAARQKWSDGEIRALMDRHHPDRRSVRAGTRTIQTRVSYGAVVEPEVDVATLPEAYRRTVPGKPATPDAEAPDREAIKAHCLEKVPESRPVEYRDRWHEGEPPESGWYEIDGEGRRYLERFDTTLDAGTMRPMWGVTINQPDGSTRVLSTLKSIGKSLIPRPGLDLLRWRHAPEGVSVARRVSVKVR